MLNSMHCIVVSIFCSFYFDMVGCVYHPSYDHQTETYKATFEPIACSDPVTVTTYFSPDHSVGTYVQLIESAVASIDLYTPGLSSWIGCTDDDDGCVGCSLKSMHNELFPVFPALLNAVHEKNVRVRIITNDFGTKTCRHKIAPFDWLFLNGIEIKTFTSVTFMHAKVMVIDKGKKTSISSVNFSRAAFTGNREAGVVLSGDCEEAVNFVLSVFEFDWKRANEYSLTNTYTQSERQYITNKDHLPVVVPPPPDMHNSYVTSVQNVSDVEVTSLYTSPDFALAHITKTLESVQTSFRIMIYQITDTELCDALITMQTNGIDVKVLVSSYIYSYYSWRAAQRCYKKLYDHGVTIQKSPSYYKCSHQKVWIVDDKEVHLSTGNWSPTDYPVGTTFPPYGSRGWKICNRNFIVGLKNPKIVSIFKNVMDADWIRGKHWTP